MNDEQKGPRFHRADGQPEPRSVDDILRDAAARGAFDNLPGKGRPLDLEDYFSDGPENRLVHKLLKDNQILPQPLQDRKEAEAAQQAALDLLARGAQALREAREAIHRASVPLVACFPDRQAAMDHFGLEAWPSCFAAPASDPKPDLRRVVRQAEHLRSLTGRYNARLEAFTSRYRELLEQTNACVRRHNDGLASTGRLTAGFRMMPLCDVAAREREVREQFPPLPLLPEDLPGRVRAFVGKGRRPFWGRLPGAFLRRGGD